MRLLAGGQSQGTCCYSFFAAVAVWAGTVVAADDAAAVVAGVAGAAAALAGLALAAAFFGTLFVRAGSDFEGVAFQSGFGSLLTALSLLESCLSPCVDHILWRSTRPS